MTGHLAGTDAPSPGCTAWLVTGLRHAGKTTCIAALARDVGHGPRAALLTHGEAAKALTDGIADLPTTLRPPGCPCCMGQLTFHVALTRLLRGLADGTTLWIEGGQEGHGAAERSLIERDFGDHLSLAGVVAVIDPRSCREASAALQDRLARLAGAANRVIANHADQADPAARAAFEDFMARHAPQVPWRYAVRCAVPATWLVDGDAAG